MDIDFYSSSAPAEFRENTQGLSPEEIKTALMTNKYGDSKGPPLMWEILRGVDEWESAYKLIQTVFDRLSPEQVVEVMAMDITYQSTIRDGKITQPLLFVFCDDVLSTYAALGELRAIQEKVGGEELADMILQIEFEPKELFRIRNSVQQISETSMPCAPSLRDDIRRALCSAGSEFIL